MKTKYIVIGGVTLVLFLLLSFVWVWINNREPEDRPVTAEGPPPDTSPLPVKDLEGLDTTIPPLVEEVASLKTKQAVLTARQLTAVLQRHGVPVSKALRELDERDLPEMTTDAQWKEYIGAVDSLLRPRRTGLGRRAHNLYVDIPVTVARESPSSALRFSAAYFLAGDGIPGFAQDGPLPEVHAAPEQIAIGFECAFERLFSPGENRSDYDLQVTAATIFFNELPPTPYYLWALARTSALPKEELTALLRQKQKRIAERTQEAALKAKSKAQKEAFQQLQRLLVELLPSDISAGVVKELILTRQIEPVLRAWLKTVNDDDSAAALKLMSGLSGKFQQSLLNTKPLVKAFARLEDTTSLEFRGFRILTDRTPKKEDWSEFEIQLFFFEVNAHNEKRAFDMERCLVQRNGRWYLTEAN